MKKIYIIMLGILVVSIVTAGIMINKNISVSPEQKIKLTEMGITTPTYQDIEIGNNYIKRCLYQKDAINTCSRKFKTYYIYCIDKGFIPGEGMNCSAWIEKDYTSNEMNAILDAWQEERLKEIADVNIARDSQTKEIIQEGEITIQ